MKLGFLKNNTPNEAVADAWDSPAPGTVETTDATPLLRTPAQTAAWILLRKPVWGTLAALLVIVLVISGAAFVKRNDSMSGTVSAAVKEVPRAAAPKPSFEEDEQDPSMREEDENTDPDEENDNENEDEDSENDEENDENTDPDSSDENNNDTDTGEETPDTAPPDQYQEPPQTPTPSIPDGNTPPAPQPAIPTPGPTVPYKTATATRNIVCSPEATIRIEAVGTGTITLQATGAQPAQGQGRVSVEARGTQIQVSATSQSTSRAFVQFAWAWTQGGYCRQY